jgi:hypothetical protein
MNCLIVTKYQVKRLIVILLGILLLGQQIVPLSAGTLTPMPCCAKVTASADSVACDTCECGASKPFPDSKPAPAVPAQTRVQNQILLLLPALVTWTLPENKAPSFASTEKTTSTDAIAPLYAKNCALLL